MSYIEDSGYFTYDGVKSSDYGVWIHGGGTFGAPARRVAEYVVPGRNGTLTMDEGAFDELEHIYPAFIARSFAANIEAFRNQLMARAGHVRLTDSFHPGEFYRARYSGGLEVETAPGGVAGSFELTFMRDPRRFLLSGERMSVVTEAQANINNPTMYAARPLLHVTGYGTLTIGSDVITIANVFSDVYIDSEIQDCYKGTQNANAAVTFQSGEFPTFKAGINNITKAGNITSVAITPRWWLV